MLKFVILGAVVALVFWWLFGRAGRVHRAAQQKRRASSATAEDMVACAHCGVHLPRSDALAARGLHYCIAAHRDAEPPAR